MEERAELLQFTVMWVIYLFVATAIHEYGHLLMMRYLEWHGYISSMNLDAVYWYVVPTDVMIKVKVGLAGGLLVVFVYGLMSIFDVDNENRYARIYWIIYHFIYALCEGYALGYDHSYYAVGQLWGMTAATFWFFAAVISGRFKIWNPLKK